MQTNHHPLDSNNDVGVAVIGKQPVNKSRRFLFVFIGPRVYEMTGVGRMLPSSRRTSAETSDDDAFPFLGIWEEEIDDEIDGEPPQPGERHYHESVKGVTRIEFSSSNSRFNWRYEYHSKSTHEPFNTDISENDEGTWTDLGWWTPAIHGMCPDDAMFVWFRQRVFTLLLCVCQRLVPRLPIDLVKLIIGQLARMELNTRVVLAVCQN